MSRAAPAALLAALPSLASAGFPYATFGLGYSSSRVELGGVSEPVDLDGVQVSVGFDLTEALLLDLRYASRSGEQPARQAGQSVMVSAEGSDQELGLTFHRPLDERSDIYLLARLHRLTFEAAINGQVVIDQSDQGYTGGIGLRTRLLPAVEGYAEYRHTEIAAANSDHIDLGLRLYLSPHSALSVNYALREEPPRTTTGFAFYY